MATTKQPPRVLAAHHRKAREIAERVPLPTGGGSFVLIDELAYLIAQGADETKLAHVLGLACYDFHSAKVEDARNAEIADAARRQREGASDA